MAVSRMLWLAISSKENTRIQNKDHSSESEAKHKMQHSVQPKFRKVMQSASAGGAYLAQ